MDIWPKWPGGWLIKPAFPPRPPESRRPSGSRTAHAGKSDSDREPAASVPPARPDSHIILVGLPGAGKTSVGSILAKSLNCPFIDLDAEIVRRTGRAISAIFASHGEQHFRLLERDATLRLRDARPSVVAPGGGWVTVPDTVALVRPPAHMAYLKVDPATAARRLYRSAHLRPLLRRDPHSALAQLLDARRAAYEAADWVIDTEVLDRQEVIDRILLLLSAGTS
jgi:shikimate kinase